MAARADLVVEQGADFAFQIQVLEANGAVADVSGCTLTAHVTAYPGANAFTEMDVSSGANGVYSLSMDAATTLALGIDRGVWDAVQVDGSNNTVRIAEGRVTVMPAASLPYQQNEPDANTSSGGVAS